MLTATFHIDMQDTLVEVIVDLYKYRYLATSQIEHLHFPSLQTTNRRLRSLINQDLITFFLIPNIPERIYHINRTCWY